MSPSKITQIILPLIILPAHLISASRTPLMGYNTYNDVACSPNATHLTTTINAFVSQGFPDAGYTYFQLDCGWASRDGLRNATTGALAYNAEWFPDGIQPLSDLARSKGLKWSMYSDAGVKMCDTTAPSPVAGSLGFEMVDAMQFAEWGTEYLKYDNCYASGPAKEQNAPKDPRTDFPARFAAMWDACQSVGIEKMLICQWGTPYESASGLEGPEDWTGGISTSFRLSDDIASGWNNVIRILNEAIYVSKSNKTGPGHFGDMDLLEVGNEGMSIDEQASHFAAWAMHKSALMVSTNVMQVSDAAKEILLNKELIAVNQDTLGKPVTLVQRWTEDRDLYAGPLVDGDVAVLAINLQNNTRALTIDFSSLGLQDATVKDLWTHVSTTGQQSYSATVPAHGSIALRLSNTKPLPPAPGQTTYQHASSALLSNGATLASFSGGTKAINIGGNNTFGGSITFSNITATSATTTLLFDYINCEVGFLGNGTNERNASVSVNGGAGKVVSFPLSGYDWDRDVMKGYKVELGGFEVGERNSVRIEGEGTWFEPEIVGLGIEM